MWKLNNHDNKDDITLKLSFYFSLILSAVSADCIIGVVSC